MEILVRLETEVDEVGSSTAAGDWFAGQKAWDAPSTKWADIAMAIATASRRCICVRIIPMPRAPIASKRISNEEDAVEHGACERKADKHRKTSSNSVIVRKLKQRLEDLGPERKRCNDGQLQIFNAAALQKHAPVPACAYPDNVSTQSARRNRFTKSTQSQTEG